MLLLLREDGGREGHGRAVVVSSDTKVFGLMFSCLSLYFSGIMVRLQLVLAPAACILGGITVSRGLGVFSRRIWRALSRCRRCANIGPCTADLLFSAAVVASLLALSLLMVHHAVFVAANAYCASSLAVETAEGPADDFREAYSWLRANTAEDAKVLAWWDHGYQIAALANRTTFADGNTWNASHIATVGRVLVSSEEQGGRLMRELGADYVLVVWGGLVGYASDDLAKILWPIRIASGTDPQIRESDYLTRHGELRLDRGAPRALRESLLYKASHWGIERIEPAGAHHAVRGIEPVELESLEEAFTSTHWLVRIYRLREARGKKNRS